MSRLIAAASLFGYDDNYVAVIAGMTVRIPWYRKLKRNAHAGIPGTVRQNVWIELQTAAIDFGLRPGFTRADVETAFRRLARKMHPDAGGIRSLARKKMQGICEPLWLTRVERGATCVRKPREAVLRLPRIGGHLC
jgi:hypothetical protein